MKGVPSMEKNTSMHIREYGGLLATPEKKALLWLAQKTPRYIHSDHLTLLGLAAMLLAGASYWAASYEQMCANPGCGILWPQTGYGDSLDGTLARVRNCQRPRYGYYVDHVIDLIGTTALLGGLAVSGYMNHTIDANASGGICIGRSRSISGDSRTAGFPALLFFRRAY